MTRTPLKRFTPMPRPKHPLKRSPLRPGAPMARSRMRARSARKDKQLRARKVLFVAVVAERGNICELEFSEDCRHQAECFHHLLKQSQGGDDSDPRLLKLSCSPCNQAVENEPARALAAGLAVRRSDFDPVTLGKGRAA